MIARTIRNTMNTLLGVVLVCHVSLVTCRVAEAAELKIGYVSLAKVFDGYEKTKSSDASLEQKGKQKESELEGRVNELKKLRQSLELLNEQAREAKAKEIEEKADELQRFRTNAARDLRRDRDKIAKDILQEIQSVVEEYAKANNFSVILDERSLLYGQDVYDVSDEVLKLLNSRHGKAKSAKP